MRTKIFYCSVFFAIAFCCFSESVNAQFYATVADSLRVDSIRKASSKPKIQPRTIEPTGVKALGSIAINRNPYYQNKTPDELIQEVFAKTGSCVTVTNTQYKIFGWNGTKWTSTDPRSGRGLAYFNREEATSFPIEEGLVMSTGNVHAAEGPNQSDNALSDGSTHVGDADLLGLLPAGLNYEIKNVCVLEFDFVPTANEMLFRYVFASEEYPEYVNSRYNDVFGFFVNEVYNGSAGPKTNIARLPDGQSNSGRYEVSINNVNNGGWFTNQYLAQGNATNGVAGHLPISNQSFFVPNLRNSPVTEFDGYTTLLTARYSVTPCKKYHLKLAVGNAGDHAYGSGVFLEAKSFDAGQDLAFTGNGVAGDEFLIKGCESQNYFDVTRTILSDATATIEINFEGSAIKETDYQVYNDAGGIYPVLISPSQTTGVHFKDNIIMQVHFDPTETTKRIWLRPSSNATVGRCIDISMNCPCAISNNAQIVKHICITNNIDGNFDVGITSSCNGANGILNIDASPSAGTTGSGSYKYQITKLGSTETTITWQTSPIFPNLSNGTYVVKVQDRGTCANKTLSDTIELTDLIAYAGPNQTNCGASNNQFSMTGNQPGTGVTGTWTVVSGNVTIANKNLYNTLVTLNSGTTATLQWKLDNGTCSSTSTMTITLSDARPAPPVVTSPVNLCVGSTATPLSATALSGNTLKWFNPDGTEWTGDSGGAASPTPNTAVAGTQIYTVVQYKFLSCESNPASITVNVTPPPTATISGPATFCESNPQINLTITVSGGTAPWSIDYIERDLLTHTEINRSIANSAVATIIVSATPQNVSEYIITKITDGKGCISHYRDSVTVQKQPCGFEYKMLVWLKANQGYDAQPSLNKVTWYDMSGNPNMEQEAQKSGSTINIVKQNSAINFNPAIKFDGTSDHYLTGKTSNTYGFSYKTSVFTVMQNTATSSTGVPQGIISTDNGSTRGQGIVLDTISGASPYYRLEGDIAAYSPSNSGSTNNAYPILITGQYKDSLETSGSIFRENGALKATHGATSNGTFPDTTKNFRVGGRLNGNTFDGKIAEIIYFFTNMDSIEIEKIESYLAIKYGIGKSNDYRNSEGNPTWIFYGDGTTTNGNSGYQERITGIGHDNGFALDQRISQNTSPGDIVTVAHNATAFVTDQSQASAITADKSYLIWGALNGSKTIFGNSATYGGRVLRLLERNWRVRKTGTVGNVSMQFDTAGLMNNTDGWSLKPALAVLTSGTNFTNGTITTYHAASGYSKLTFLNVDLKDMYHFTLALTKSVTADAGPDQTACSNNTDYEFTMAATPNPLGTYEAGSWSILSEPAAGSVTIVSPSSPTTKVKLSIPGTAKLVWKVWNTDSFDEDTSHINITRYTLPLPPNSPQTMPAVCQNTPNNDSVVITNSNPNYSYTLFDAVSGGSQVGTTVYGKANSNSNKIVIKPGNSLKRDTCYFVEIRDTITGCPAEERWKVCVPVYASVRHQDIRLQACPFPKTHSISLINYINLTAEAENVTFSYPPKPSLITGNTISNADVTPGSTYVLNYEVVGKCGTQTAKMYLKILNGTQTVANPIEKRICHQIDAARNIQLQQILGLDVSGGYWTFDATLLLPNTTPNPDYITTNSGAYIFNAQQAWNDNKGSLVGVSDRRFIFTYTPHLSQCSGLNSVYTLIVTVTPNL
ncbi:MAG: choice-of-anchor L domain-containing protein [Prevotellaceae bacterium]|jgi:hypothetical protein|nr:choice-of-anchor L domain-containing protein [Prevotellaceae bacterium]